MMRDTRCLGYVSVVSCKSYAVTTVWIGSVTILRSMIRMKNTISVCSLNGCATKVCAAEEAAGK